jgi:hypothetical protein
MVFPRLANDPVVDDVRQVLASTTTAILLPVCFVTPGLNVDLGSLDAKARWQLRRFSRVSASWWEPPCRRD